jgi:phospholipid N-methyltransferase
LQRWTFLREFVRDPARVGSVTPSSRQLADLVVRCADLRRGQAVVELGAGTGPVTQAILRRHPDVDLLAVEPSEKLAGHLRERFPGLQVREAFADRALPRLVDAWGHPHVDRVVSGLPWTLWTTAEQDEVLAGITAALGPDGRFVTYTYVSAHLSPKGRQFRRRLRKWFRSVRRTDVLWANVPPAFVLVADGPIRR